MVYAQLSGASSLRVLEAGYNSQSKHHYHLGTRTLRRSTLSDANATRHPEPLADIVRALMNQAHRHLRTEMKDILYRLDSTSFTLKRRGFDAWTKETRTRNTQGIKLHVLYEAAPEIPVCFSFIPVKVNDRDEAVKLEIEPEAIYDKLLYSHEI
ncbi:hypothetical protein AGMMS50256_21630 [Betaproteobacteria bacterium]|nr:hypothetical protein AGMMS50256_21630 [Betaproteobacteria bacterium]